MRPPRPMNRRNLPMPARKAQEPSARLRARRLDAYACFGPAVGSGLVMAAVLRQIGAMRNPTAQSGRDETT